MARFTIESDFMGALLRIGSGLVDGVTPITEDEAAELVDELAAYFGDHIRGASGQ